MGGKSDYFSVVRLFQSPIPSLSRHVAHTESEGTQTPKISSCFSKLLIMFFQRRNFFSPRLCVWRLWSLPSAANFAWTSFVFTNASGSWEQRRNRFFFFSFQIFLMKISAASLLRLWHRASLVESFFGFFFRLVENCKDSRGMSSASVIRHLAVWISDSFLGRNKGGDDNVFGPVRLVPGIY